jgi:hypothetical protein
MNWGGAPSGTGAGAGCSGRSRTAGGVGADGVVGAAGGAGGEAGAGSGGAGVGGRGFGAEAGGGGVTGGAEAVTAGRTRLCGRCWPLRLARCLRWTGRRWRRSGRAARAPRSGEPGVAADPGRATSGGSPSRPLVVSRSPRSVNTTLTSAAAAARESSAAAGQGLDRAASVRSRLRGRAWLPAPEAAAGAAKIEPLDSADAAGAPTPAAGTSKTLRRPPPGLSEVKGIYLREARTPKNGPPGGRADSSSGAPSA